MENLLWNIITYGLLAIVAITSFVLLPKIFLDAHVNCIKLKLRIVYYILLIVFGLVGVYSIAVILQYALNLNGIKGIVISFMVEIIGNSFYIKAKYGSISEFLSDETAYDDDEVNDDYYYEDEDYYDNDNYYDDENNNIINFEKYKRRHRKK